MTEREGRSALAAGKPQTAVPEQERDLVFSRIFDAPPNLVFDMWTNPEHIAHWYGPKGFSVTFLQMDVRPGGAWRKCMRSPEGIDYWREGVFHEVVRPKRLVFTYRSDDPAGIQGHETIVTLTFEKTGEKTMMRFNQSIFESVAARDSHEGGWASCMERLRAYVSQVAGNTQE